MTNTNNILTFDTSLDTMYLTLSTDEGSIQSKIVKSTDEKYHSAYLIPTIVELLNKNNLKMQDIKAIGVNIGPGSFTGIRACVTVARIFGQQLNIPVLGISSLEIISTLNTTDKDSICLLDARKNKAYYAKFSPSGNILTSPMAINTDEIETVLTDDLFIIADDKMQKLLKDLGICSINYKKQNADFGKSLAKLTLKHLKTQDLDTNWSAIKPLYIQPPPISMPKIPKLPKP